MLRVGLLFLLCVAEVQSIVQTSSLDKDSKSPKIIQMTIDPVVKPAAEIEYYVLDRKVGSKPEVAKRALMRRTKPHALKKTAEFSRISTKAVDQTQIHSTSVNHSNVPQRWQDLGSWLNAYPGCLNALAKCAPSSHADQWLNANGTAWKLGFALCCTAHHGSILCNPIADDVFAPLPGGLLVKDAQPTILSSLCQEVELMMQADGIQYLAAQQQSSSDLTSSLRLAFSRSRLADAAGMVAACRERQQCWENVENVRDLLELYGEGKVEDDGEVKCFPRTAKVALPGGTHVSVSTLQQGTALLFPTLKDDSQAFEKTEYLMNAHVGDPLHERRLTNFVECSHELMNEGEPLLATKNHLVFVKRAGEKPCHWELLPAGEIRTGDGLQALVDGKVQTSRVTSVRVIQSEGTYAPLTTSGRLFVQGVAVSSYAISSAVQEQAWQDNEHFKANVESWYKVFTYPVTVFHYMGLDLQKTFAAIGWINGGVYLRAVDVMVQGAYHLGRFVRVI